MRTSQIIFIEILHSNLMQWELEPNFTVSIRDCMGQGLSSGRPGEEGWLAEAA